GSPIKKSSRASGLSSSRPHTLLIRSEISRRSALGRFPAWRPASWRHHHGCPCHLRTSRTPNVQARGHAHECFHLEASTFEASKNCRQSKIARKTSRPGLDLHGDSRSVKLGEGEA